MKSFSAVALALGLGCMALAGCGGSSDNGEVTITTGSLSKGEFAKRADGICQSSRAKFNSQYGAFVKGNISAASQDAALAEAVETIVMPNFEGMIDKIAELGAPKGDEKEVDAFLNALQRRLGVIQEDPEQLTSSAYPFAHPAKLAGAYGLAGCASSLS
jgi:hypothetical protein